MFSSKEVRSAIQEGMKLNQAGKAMLGLMMEESNNHYCMGLLYNYMVDKKLAENEGYQDVRDYFSQHLRDLSYTSVRMYGAVAAKFSEEVSTRFGVTCLYLLLTYKEVAELKVNHEDPEGTLIEVPGKNGAVTPKPFGECSVDEMRRAIQRKRKPSSSKPLPKEDMALAERYQEAVKSRFAKGVVVKVEVRNQKGDSVLDIKGIPVAQVSTLIEALMDELPEAPELLPPVPQVPRVAPAATVS